MVSGELIRVGCTSLSRASWACTQMQVIRAEGSGDCAVTVPPSLSVCATLSMEEREGERNLEGSIFSQDLKYLSWVCCLRAALWHRGEDSIFHLRGDVTDLFLKAITHNATL